MYRFFLVLSLIVLFGVGELTAQTPAPTPTPASPHSTQDVQGVPAIALDYRSDDRALPELGRVGVDFLDQRTLTLKEAIERALENNRDIEVSRKTARMAEFDLESARGIYQPRLSGQLYYDRTTAPNVGIFSTNQTTTNGSVVGNAVLTGSLPNNGTQFSAAFNNTRVTTNNPISVLSPQLNSNLGFSIVQPLFRGRRFDTARRTIEIAKRNIELTDTQFRQRSIETVAAVERVYWDLTFALRNLGVQRDAVKDAKDQLAHNRRLVDEGQLAPIDIVAAETQVANFEQAVYDALNTVNAAENALKNLIAPNRTSSIWSEALVPVEPVDIQVPNRTLAEAMTLAIENRPELEINKTQRDINAVDQRLYKDQRKPQIDLIASYSSAGIGGSQNPSFNNPFSRTTCAVPGSPECIALIAQQQAFLRQIGGSTTAITDIFQNKYPTFRAGISFNLPLFGDRSAGALYGRSLVEADRLEAQREQLEQGIQVEVRNALQSIKTAEARLRTAAISRENSSKQYESERRKLDDGQSDIYRVLERQTSLATARGNELRYRIELNKAIAELDRATGNTLKAYNIEPKLKK